MLGVALRIVRHRQVAEDVIHDAFISIWTKAGSYDGTRGTPLSWMYSIVRHQALNVVRSSQREVSVEEESIEAAESVSPWNIEMHLADSFELRADVGSLHACLTQLDAAKRNSILFAYIDGCSHSEIAERLRAPLGTVKAWIKRGISSLRECMA
jgi:RNA polymerase sigma-70 factor (ECF subfamily)